MMLPNYSTVALNSSHKPQLPLALVSSSFLFLLPCFSSHLPFTCMPCASSHLFPLISPAVTCSPSDHLVLSLFFVPMSFPMNPLPALVPVACFCVPDCECVSPHPLVTLLFVLKVSSLPICESAFGLFPCILGCSQDSGWFPDSFPDSESEDKGSSMWLCLTWAKLQR